MNRYLYRKRLDQFIHGTPVRFCDEHPWWCAVLVIAIALSFVLGQLNGARAQRRVDVTACLDGGRIWEMK